MDNLPHAKMGLFLAGNHHGRTTKNNSNSVLAEGFVTFVFVDHEGKPIRHQLVLDQPVGSDEEELRQRAMQLS